VPDEDDGTGDAGQVVLQVAGVVCQPAQRVGRDVDGVAIAQQDGGDAVQLEASAQAPCTSTVVGLAAVLNFGDAACAGAACAEAIPRGTSAPAIASEAAIAAVRLRGMAVMRVRNIFLPFG